MEEEIKNKGEITVYQTDDGNIKLDVRLEEESVWLTQKMMAELFHVKPQNITMHLKNIYKEGELVEEATCKDFLQVQIEGDREINRRVKYYNLDAIISVGYRIKSLIATRFRIWATQKLKEYIIKGFVLDDERLKNPPIKGSPVPDYFDEMLERIRDIRASEKRMYLRVKEIFTLAADYESDDKYTTLFFQTIQNKLHYAATGMTAPEIIKKRADHQKLNMGLTSWKSGEVIKTDVTIAKNYLTEDEIKELNRIVVMWLDYAEDQATRRKQVFMKDWKQKLNDFLEFNDREVLGNAGIIKREEADKHAKAEYDLYSAERRREKEAIGERENIKALEESAKLLSKR